MNTKGMLFDIQSFSVHDGPGCRTTVFMSGCPMRCRWCANPESWSSKARIMFSEASCRYRRGCLLCKGACSRGGLRFDNEKLLLNREICDTCVTLECVKSCCHNALKQCSKEYSVDTLVTLLERDANHWGGNGGVTFSGGEPLMQEQFLMAVLKECAGRGFHTAIETTAYADCDIFLSIMKYIDFAFIDIKHMNRERHREKTGVYNDRILQNVSDLVSSGWDGRLVIRVPLIGGFNDDPENIRSLLEFMKQNHLFEINMLPFHKLGESKWTQLGKIYDYTEEGMVSAAQMENIQELFLDNGIACYLAGDTLF